MYRVSPGVGKVMQLSINDTWGCERANHRISFGSQGSLPWGVPAPYDAVMYNGNKFVPVLVVVAFMFVYVHAYVPVLPSGLLSS